MSGVPIGAFLLARIAEDESDADELERDMARWSRERAVGGPDGSQGSITLTLIVPGAAMHPERIRAECEAKRALIELTTEATRLDRNDEMEHGTGDDEGAEWLGETILRVMAQPYRDRPDFDPAWDTRTDGPLPQSLRERMQ